MITEQLRAEFEAWADDRGFPLKRTVHGEDYQDLRTQGAFEGYQAGRAALQAQGPADPVLPYEQALAELVDKIVPGLDTGDLLADAQKASAALPTGETMNIEQEEAAFERYAAAQEAVNWWPGITPKMIAERAWKARAALQSQDREDENTEVDAAVEAVRKQFCALPRYSFVTRKGGVSRVHDSTGNWIEFDQAHALFDPISVDHARRIEGEGK